MSIALLVYIKFRELSLSNKPKKLKDDSMTPPLPNIIIQAKVLINRFVQKGIVTKNINIFFTLFDCLEIKYGRKTN